MSMDRTAEPRGERLIGAIRASSAPASGAHGIVLTLTRAQLRFVSLEVEATLPHAFVTYTVTEDEVQVSGDKGW